jgi:protein involved in polysaccharide export with SLBB domain
MNTFMNLKNISALLLAICCLISPVFSEIEAGQSVKIKIMGVPAEEKAKIDEVYPVSKKGMVNLPFIGEIRAAGMESDELAKSIQNTYRVEGIYNHATIQVIANEIEDAPLLQVVHIGGQVREPGPRPFAKGLTVFQAVQAAGGATEFGSMKRVTLFREGKQQKINLETIEGKGVITQPLDTIEVPQKGPFGG